MSPADIRQLTEMSGNRIAIHYDEAVAEDLPGPGTVFLELDLRFVQVVRPGDTTTGVVEVTAVRDDKPITHLDVRVERQDGSVAVEGTAVCCTMPLSHEP